VIGKSISEGIVDWFHNVPAAGILHDFEAAKFRALHYRIDC
jgi:hypothetical protein